MNPALVLEPQQHSGELLFGNGFTQAQREFVGNFVRIHVGPEYTVPQGEGGAKIFSAMKGGRMMDAMVMGSDNEPRQRADVYLQIGVFPELNQEAQGVADPGFSRT